MKICAQCGMDVATKEYHPFGVCLMHLACRSPKIVRANLNALEQHFNKQLSRENKSLQAKIDALMIEHCPEEMTTSQRDEWERNQAALQGQQREQKARKMNTSARI